MEAVRADLALHDEMLEDHQTFMLYAIWPDGARSRVGLGPLYEVEFRLLEALGGAFEDASVNRKNG